MRSFIRGIDVNRAPSTVVVDVEEDAGVSSPNSTVSSVMSGKRSERDLMAAAAAAAGGVRIVEDNEAERASSSLGGGGSDDEDGGANGDDGSRKKLRLTKEQALVLEETFKEHSTLSPVSGISVIFSICNRLIAVVIFFKKF